MYIALNSTIVSGRVPWPEFARLASEIGFGGVEPPLERLAAGGVEQTKSLLDRLKIAPATFGFPVEFRKDDDAFRSGLAKLDSLGHFAAAVGCPRMTTWIMSSSDLPKAEQKRVYKQRFSESAKILAQHGVRLGLEFLGPLHIRKAKPYEFIYRMDEMTEFAAECGPDVGLLLDAWHWHHAGATAKDIVAAGKSRIVHVHLSDAKRIPADEVRDSDRLMPGEGVIDWAGFFGALKKAGYEDAVAPEVFGRGLKEMKPEEAARLALDSARNAMRKGGVL